MNYFKATDGGHLLECVSDTSTGTVYVYGLADNIDVSILGDASKSLDIKLKIGNYFAP